MQPAVRSSHSREIPHPMPKPAHTPEGTSDPGRDALPGRETAYRPDGAMRSHDPLRGLVFERAAGPHVWDTDQRCYLDLICGYSSCNLGHAQPELVRALTEQAQQLHFALGGQSPWRSELEAELARRWRSPSRACYWEGGEEHRNASVSVESDSGKVWLCTTGARAVEVAWKIAHARRPGGVVRFDLGYHGRSLATGCISDTRRSTAMPAEGLETCLVAFPTGCRCDVDVHLDEDVQQATQAPPQFTTEAPHDAATLCEVCEASLQQAEQVLDRHARRMSMMILEPAIGSRGYYFAPSQYYRRLVALGRERELLIVSDEVQMGLRRLGPMLVSQSDGWFADLSILGKSLGGGLVPMAAVIGEARLMDGLEEGIESETFAASPLACRLGIEVLKLLDAEPCVSSDALGRRYRHELRASLPSPVSVRGRGMATALGLDAWGDRGPAIASSWTRELSRAGILVHLTGAARNRIALLPPLNVPSAALLGTVLPLSSTLERALGGNLGV
jgi:4-aminobutyrate aminotransferase / (S)-3-amino-2-methylpropionate transaminase / 5-aminovalerate transaminase